MPFHVAGKHGTCDHNQMAALLFFLKDRANLLNTRSKITDRKFPTQIGGRWHNHERDAGFKNRPLQICCEMKMLFCAIPKLCDLGLKVSETPRVEFCDECLILVDTRYEKSPFG